MHQPGIARCRHHHGIPQSKPASQFGLEFDIGGKRRTEAYTHDPFLECRGEKLVDPAAGEMHPLADLSLRQTLHMIEPCGPDHQLLLVHALSSSPALAAFGYKRHIGVAFVT